MHDVTDKPAEAFLKSLDMTNEHDRGLVRRKVADHETKHRRWPVDEQFKADAVKALKVALRWSLEKQDHRGIRGIVDTLKSIEGQNQADEHLDARLIADASRPSTSAPVINIAVASPDQLVALETLTRRHTLPHPPRPATNGTANGNGNGHH